MATMVELRPNRRLLDHEFEGYKLNLQSLAHWTQTLGNSVDRMQPDDVQYSFLHAKLFALHNHLVQDLWDHRFNYYYIDKTQHVRRIGFISETRTFESKVVYDIPIHVERKSGHFNLSLAFPSRSLAVIGDGTGYLHIVYTSDRPSGSNSEWKTCYSTPVLGEEKYFIVLDAKAQQSNDKIILHCLLQSIEQNEKHFNSVLTWVTYKGSNEDWGQVSMKQLQGKGIVHYAAFESNLSAIYVASDHQFKFTLDTENDIDGDSKVAKKEDTKIVYSWLQTTEDITISLKLPQDYDKNLFHVDVSPLVIKLSYGENSLIDGKLKHKVDSELTTWNIDNGRVDILLTKDESMLWDELVQGGDPRGEQIMDPSLVEEAHQRLMHLCSETEVTSSDQSVAGFSTQELEECDAASEEDTILVRFDAASHRITHRIPLSVHQHLFTTCLELNEAPAIVLRHDIDACIWQPFAKLLNETWPIHHQGTLSAFGYVQSSKQNRKFTTCSPDFSYSVVSEATQHIFIYRKASTEGCTLRHRINGEAKTIKVGQQHLFNVAKYGEVLGINATNNYLFVLTENYFMAIEIM